MRLRRLTLRDFGLFRGEQTLSLTPRQKWGRTRPVILIGGHNGAGKTTILEALRFCLYGRLALGARVTDAAYQSFLKERIHRNRDALIQPFESSVKVEFEYAQSGKRAVFTVERTWKMRAQGGADEDFIVLRDGLPLEDVEAEHWSDFVRSLIPPGLSQLFFFDGEKIQRLAEEHGESETLAESVKALLGLDLVERLQADLDLYAAREVKKSGKAGDIARLSEIDKRQVELEDRGRMLRQNEAQKRAQIDHKTEEIKRKEQELAQSGQGLAERRVELRQQQEELPKKIAHVERLLQDLCEGPLPFAACPTLCAELLDQLDKETLLERWQATHDDVAKALAAASDRLTRGSFPKQQKWNADTRAAVAAQLEIVASERGRLPPALQRVRMLHGLAEQDRVALRKSIAEALESVPNRVGELTKELHQVESHLRGTKERLNKAPEAEEVAPLIRALSALQEEHAQLTMEMRQKEERRLFEGRF